MRTEHVAAFVEVARETSFTRCAKAVGMAQSTLSRRVSALEASLGAPLFKRSSSGLALTEAGAAFLRLAPEVLAAADRARAACAATPSCHESG